MCGICGKFRPGGVTRDEIYRMSTAIVHRGPDADGFYVNGRIGLGSRRLSIIDLDRGHMPLSNEDRSIWIVYNGEIYNYRSLRKELEEKGHRFTTSSDTEVIVHLYEEEGERCVERLNGMFAFAIWDARTEKLFLARDRIGQKPLFYAQCGDVFLFASEVKAILAADEVPREVDLESMHHYLSLRFIPAPRTMLRGIQKLPPAHYLVLQNNEVRISRYWDLSLREKLAFSEKEFVDQLSEKLSRTVASHLVGDVPVGAFLSGGMDSSTVVAMMSQANGTPFKTFAIGVEEQGFNELPYARLVADQVGTCHVEERVQSDLITLLPRIIWHLDEPSDPIAACMFHAAALASRHVKVVLGGDGGDELFAGFDRYLGLGYIDWYAAIPALLRHRLISPLIDRTPENFGYKSLTQKLRWLHQLSLLPAGGERYAEATCFFRFNHADKQALFSNNLWQKVEALNSSKVIVDRYNNAHADDPVDRMLYADFMTRLPEHSLMLTDRMTMAHSVEARSPFLDHTLVEFLAAFPSGLKIRNRELKYVLRQVAKRYLPATIIEREKQGFMFPIAYWFQRELYGFISDLLMNSSFVREGLFRPQAVRQLLEDHRANRIDNHVRLWMLLNLELWYQLYIERVDVATMQERMQIHLSRTSRERPRNAAVTAGANV